LKAGEEALVLAKLTEEVLTGVRQHALDDQMVEDETLSS
jgi:hypothetical protein